MIILKNYLILSNDYVDMTDNIKKITKQLDFSYEDIIKFDMSITPLEDVIEELNTYGLFSENKVVVLTSCDFLTGDKNRQSIPQNESLLEKYINNPNELNSLIICVSKLDERKKISKLLREKCEIVNLDTSIDEKIKSNLGEYKMDNKTINYFINYLKSDKERIMNELNKLKMYKLDEKVITIQDINDISIKDFDDDIFSLINLIINKNINQAFKVYDILIKNGEPLIKIVITLLDQFRLIYKCKVLIDDGKSKDEIVSLVKQHPYRVKLAINSSYSFTYKELEEYIIKLGEIDIKTKMGIMADNTGFDLFLINLL